MKAPLSSRLLVSLSCALSLEACGYTWGPQRGDEGAQRPLKLQDLTGTPGLARAFERAARGALGGCAGVRGAQLRWGAGEGAGERDLEGDPLPLYATSGEPATTRSAQLKVTPPPTLATLTLELSFERDPPLIVEVYTPRVSAPLGAHPSVAESGLGVTPSALHDLAAFLARKAGDACALSR